MGTWLKWVILLLTLLDAGYMIFDGGRALTKGDYIRPASGTHAGQLGPWAKLVKALGIDPESTLMKIIFVVWGLNWLGIALGFANGAAWGWKAMLLVNICSLWYLPVGTAINVIQIILLFVLRYTN